MLRADLVDAGVEGEGALDGVAELADVAGPGVVHHQIERLAARRLGPEPCVSWL